MPDEKNNRIVTPEFRLSFPNLKEVNELDGKYAITMLFAKGTDISALKAAAKTAAVAKWADKIPSNLRSPFGDGNDKEFDGYADCTFVRAKSKAPVLMFDASKQEIIDPYEVYAGCYCRASVTAFGYGGKGTSFEPGVGFALHAIQKLRDGEPFGASNRAAAMDFNDLPDEPNKPAAKAAPAKSSGLDDW